MEYWGKSRYKILPDFPSFKTYKYEKLYVDRRKADDDNT